MIRRFGVASIAVAPMPVRLLGFLLLVPAAYAAPVLADREQAFSSAEGRPTLHGAFNNGEDFTRPLNRFDLRERYERLRDDGGLEPEKWVTTLRADLWTGSDAGWKLYGRVDVPLVYANDVTSSFNPEGHARFGLGDLLTQVAIIPPPPMPRLAYGFGLRVTWPTAGLNEAGQGKYQLGPLVGARYMLPEITPGSFFAIVVRYQNSITSRDENERRADINQLNIQPKFNIHLPGAWFLTLFVSKNIQINLTDDAKLFLPFDLMVGRNFGERIVASLEYSRGLVHEKGFEPYEWQLEGRVG